MKGAASLLLFVGVILVTALSCNAASISKGPPSPVGASLNSGFCCGVNGRVTACTERSCQMIKGTFFSDRRKAESACSKSESLGNSQTQPSVSVKGWCCAQAQVTAATEGTCRRGKGSFYTDRKKAVGECQTLVGPSEMGSTLPAGPPSLSLSHPVSATGPAQILPDLLVVKTGLDERCALQIMVKNSGGPIADADYRRAQISLSAGPDQALAPGESFLRMIDPSSELKRPGGTVTYTSDLVVTGRRATMVWIDTGHHITESNEQNNGDDQVVTCKAVLAGPVVRDTGKDTALQPMTVTARQIPAGMLTSAATTLPDGGTQKEPNGTADTKTRLERTVTGPISSRLPIEIISPGMDQLVRPGQDLTIRYRIVVPTEAGRVDFRLVDAAGETLASTHHRYQLPVINNVDEATLTPIGSGLMSFTGNGPDEGAAIGIGDLAFTWRLPEDLEPESTCFIEATKGIMFGKSGTMRVRADETLTPATRLGGGLRMSISGSGFYRQGQSVSVHVDIVGSEGIPPFYPSETYRQGGEGNSLRLCTQGVSPRCWDAMAYTVPVPSADMRSLSMSFTFPVEDYYYAEADRFYLQWNHHVRGGIYTGNSAPFLVRPEGVDETSILITSPNGTDIWPLGSERQVSWRIYGIENPETIHYTLTLLHEDTPWNTYPTNDCDLSCHGSGGVCRKRILMEGARIVELSEISSGFSESFELTARRGSDTGSILATARSPRFAITTPHLEVVSPAAGDTVRLLQPIILRARVHGGATGPFRFYLEHEHLCADSYPLGEPVACPACSSSGEVQTVTTTGVFYAECWRGAAFTGDLSGFRVVVRSESEALATTGDTFSIGPPTLRVLGPDSGSRWRNGQERLIRWELDIPPSVADVGATYYVDISLHNDVTGQTWRIADNVRSEDLGGTKVRGSYRWQVAHGGVGDSDRYMVEIRLRNPDVGIAGRSALFRIEP